MKKVRWVIAGIVGLGLFSAGYLAGRLKVRENSGSSESTAHRPNLRDPTERLLERTRAEHAQNPAEGKLPSYRKIVDMVSNGRLQIEGVGIRDSFEPDDGMWNFFDLSQDQFAEMQRLGRERLLERDNHILSQAKILEVSDSGIVFDLPADPEFMAVETARFVKDLSLVLGADGAAMLRPSISDAYREWTVPRRIRYSFTRGDAVGIPPDASESTRAMLEGERKFRISVNKNEDGSDMTDELGHPLKTPGLSGGMGSFQINHMNGKDEFRAYYNLWEREMNRR